MESPGVVHTHKYIYIYIYISCVYDILILSDGVLMQLTGMRAHYVGQSVVCEDRCGNPPELGVCLCVCVCLKVQVPM